MKLSTYPYAGSMVRVVISAEDVWLLANESFDLKNAT
jgi:hypothetical protein